MNWIQSRARGGSRLQVLRDYGAFIKLSPLQLALDLEKDDLGSLTNSIRQDITVCTAAIGNVTYEQISSPDF
ncbi:hypothetical protein TNCT_53261 [Trichonephila clavata]|uniref:Uncharacterized protein n=1 Tax=Trichonephila clavata TaxID=2740835 RepID=A0A8X6GX40_TRICU|nr:hypothetical protein TNCT_53261 [Trichonephila clavata]